MNNFLSNLQNKNKFKDMSIKAKLRKQSWGEK